MPSTSAPIWSRDQRGSSSTTGDSASVSCRTIPRRSPRGGDVQPQILLQLLARMLRVGEDPAAAITAPRLVLDSQTAGPFRLWWGNDLAVRVEAHAPPSWTDGLASRGHHVQVLSACDPVAVGCAQVISVTRDGNGDIGHFVGASDPRSPDGAAAAR